MKLLLVLGLLSAVAVFSEAAPRCHMYELWSCAEIAIDWLHSLPKRSLPVTEEDAEVMCTALTKTKDCAFGYRDNCTTPLQKELIALLVEGVVDLNQQFCHDKSDIRTKYLAHSTCLNKVSQMDAVKEEIEYILAALEKAQSVPENQFINYVCCGYTKSLTAFEKLGKDNCGQEAVDAVADLISMAVAQLPQVICNGFDAEEERCKSVLPPAGSKPSDKVKETEIYKVLRDVLRNWLD